MKHICLCAGLTIVLFNAACRPDTPPTTNTAPPTHTSPAAAPIEDPTTGERSALIYIPGERFGKLRGTTQESDLDFLYGDDVQKTDVPLGEGMMTEGYVLFPGSDNEARVIFPNQKNQLKTITITLESEGTEWQLPNNTLSIGSSLQEVEKLNGKPFALLGFGWDRGGYVIDWRDGKLKGLHVTLDLAESEAAETLPTELVGDKQLNSDHPLLQEREFVVRKIVVDLPSNLGSPDGIPTYTDFSIIPGRRFGTMTAELRPEDLPHLYGVESVKQQEFDLDGGVSVPGYVLFAGTRNEVEIGFPDRNNYLDEITLRLQKTDSKWHVAGSEVGVGSSLEAVSRANEGPFLLYDHNMEGGGLVSDWKGGRLEGLEVYFNTNADGRTYQYNDEHNVSSTAKAVRESNPRVKMIEMSFK